MTRETPEHTRASSRPADDTGEREALLRTPIRQFGLRIEDSPVEPLVEQLYCELAEKGLKKFRPRVYLTDEWGCPSGEPIIGIPFYLADARLAEIEQSINDLESAREIMMYLRHEAGHAFNYAFELYKTPQWRALFGAFRRPYRDNYAPVPFSRHYVRHIAGWYAQKHPDEDFAECFAVWLTPRSRWRTRYKDWPVLEKLKYVDRVARRVRHDEAIRREGTTDITADEMETTVEDFYRQRRQDSDGVSAEPLDADLQEIFTLSPRRRRGATAAADLIQQNRKALVDRVTYWSGVQRPSVKRLVEAIEQRTRDLGLKGDRARQNEHLADVASYATALIMTSAGIVKRLSKTVKGRPEG